MRAIRQTFAFRLLASLAVAGATQAHAQVSFDEAVLRTFLSEQVAAVAAREGFTRFEVQSLGKAESAATLAPCRRAEPFIPGGARLWGRTSVGVRCVDGAHWSVLVPAQVAVWGRAAVTSAAVPAASVLTAQDVQEQEVELTREPAGIARDAQSLVGKAATRHLPAGVTVRSDMVRTPQAVQAGDPVRLRIQGQGFAIAATGQAMGAAAAGQPVRVRTDLGKILNGVAREGRIVDVLL